LEDVGNDSAVIDKKYARKLPEEKELILDKKENIIKQMEKEYSTHSMTHSHNMLGRIVKYAHNKHNLIS
jgi:hypothetical protein